MNKSRRQYVLSKEAPTAECVHGRGFLLDQMGQVLACLRTDPEVPQLPQLGGGLYAQYRGVCTWDEGRMES